LKNRFAEFPVIPTANSILWYHFGNCFQRVNKKIAQHYVCCFCRTNECLQPFYTMQFINGKTCSCLTDFNWNGHMILPTTNIQPGIEKLASNIQPPKIALYWIYVKIKQVK